MTVSCHFTAKSHLIKLIFSEVSLNTNVRIFDYVHVRVCVYFIRVINKSQHVNLCSSHQAESPPAPWQTSDITDGIMKQLVCAAQSLCRSHTHIFLFRRSYLSLCINLPLNVSVGAEAGEEEGDSPY